MTGDVRLLGVELDIPSPSWMISTFVVDTLLMWNGQNVGKLSPDNLSKMDPIFQVQDHIANRMFKFEVEISLVWQGYYLDLKLPLFHLYIKVAKTHSI